MALPSTPILDDFNRADEGPPPSASWSSTTMSVISNRLVPDLDVTPQAVWLSPFTSNNQEAYISIYFDQALAEVSDFEGGGLFYIRLRNSLEGQYNLLIFITPPLFANPGTVAMRILRSGTTISDEVTIPYTSGDAFALSVADNVITGYHKPFGGDWSATVSAVDDNLTAIGLTEIEASANNGDALTSLWSLDDFGGGDHTPTGLSATSISSSQIDLVWDDVATDETGYSIERSLDGVVFSEIDTVAADSTTYSSTGLTASTLYYYRVRAFNGTGYYDYSNIDSATTSGPPLAPTLLTAQAVSAAQINLAWTDNSSDEDGFEIERSLDGITFALIDTTAAGVTTRSNTSLTPGTLYYYRVRAFNGGGSSAYSNIASATTMAPPSDPTQLTATAMSASRIDLDWSDNATNETGYKIERGLDGVNFTQIAVIGPNSNTYSDTNLAVNTTYYYRVRAFNGDGDSAYSNIASATTLTRCAGGFSYFDVLLRAARLLENLHEGTATANGTSDTLIDSHLGAFIGSGDDDFNGGSLFWKTHRYSIITDELLGTLNNAASLSNTLRLPPPITGTVTLTAPGAVTVTDDGAGVFETPLIPQTNESLDFTASVSGAAAQLDYLTAVPGSVTIEYGLPENPDYGTATDDGDGNINIWIPITQVAAIGYMDNTAIGYGFYPEAGLPLTPASVTIQVPDGAGTVNMTDDGLGGFGEETISLTDKPTEWLPFASAIGYIKKDAINGTLNVVPGTITIYWDDGVSPAESNADDGLGNIDIYIGATGVTPAGDYPATIDYQYGYIVVSGITNEQIMWLTNNQSDITHDADYYEFGGTINYTTGEIVVTTNTLQTGFVRILDLLSGPHFVPATISYTSGAITLTGLNTGDADYIGNSASYRATYNHRYLTGTVSYTTGAISILFDRLLTGNVTVTYRTEALTIFLPIIMRTVDFASDTGTVTFEPSSLFTLPTGQGDGYGLASRRYPYYLMLQKLNEALNEIKHYVLDQADIAVAEAGTLSVTTTNELSLPDTVRIFKIWNGNTDQDPQDWQLVSRFQHQNGKVRFYDYLPWNTIRIQYFADIPEANSETDCLPQQIDATWLAYEVAVKCCRWRLFQPGADEKSLTTQINDLMARATRAKTRMNLYQPQQAAMKLPIIPDR